MQRTAFLVVVFALILFGCGGGHRDLIPVAKQLDVYANAHDADGFVGLMTNDATFKAPDGHEYSGKDSIRAHMASMGPDFHVDSHGYQQSGDTVTWMSTIRSGAMAKMGLVSVKGNAMAVFSGDKVKVFTPSYDKETVGKMAFLQFYADVVNGGNIDAIDKYCAPDMVDHGLAPPNFPKGAEGVKAFFRMIREAYPDLHATPTLFLAEGDYLFVAANWTGTNKGKFMGMPATNKPLTWTVADVIRLENGKAVEHWGWDDMAERMMMSRGGKPTP